LKNADSVCAKLWKELNENGKSYWISKEKEDKDRFENEVRQSSSEVAGGDRLEKTKEKEDKDRFENEVRQSSSEVAGGDRLEKTKEKEDKDRFENEVRQSSSEVAGDDRLEKNEFNGKEIADDFHNFLKYYLSKFPANIRSEKSGYVIIELI
jgi:hypothetical protein